jgi:hypothetical protein
MFDGSFRDIMGGEYHINTVKSYRSSKRPGQDINIVSPLSRNGKDRYARLMIFMDGDSDSQSHSAHLEPKEMKGHYGCGVEPHMRRIPDITKDQVYVELKKRQATSSDGSCKLQTRQILPMVRNVFLFKIGRCCRLHVHRKLWRPRRNFAPINI